MTKIRGTLIAPGVSANNRYYSPAMIRQAVERAQPRIAAGRMLLKSYHGSPDTLGIVGAIRSLRVAEDGSAEFTGELADSSSAREVAALIRGQQPFVNGVSIEGRWLGDIKRVKVSGQTAETAEGLELTAAAVTAEPGVDRARVVAESLLTGIGSRVIFEQAPGPVVPIPPERTEREWAAMTSEERDPAAGQVWAARLAEADARRRANPAPFWRGLNLTSEGA